MPGRLLQESHAAVDDLEVQAGEGRGRAVDVINAVMLHGDRPQRQPHGLGDIIRTLTIGCDETASPRRDIGPTMYLRPSSLDQAVHALAAAGKVETRRIQRAVPQWSWTGGYTTTVDRMVLACRCS